MTEQNKGELPKIRSGIAPLDRQIGGIVAGRPYVLSGNPGTGKSVSCLEFVDVALTHGERAALLTHDDPRDVLATAEFLGMDIEPALADGRLVILRFHLDFIRRFGRAAGPDEVFEELRRQLRDLGPSRLAIDSVVPFLEGGGHSSAVMFSLTRHLEEMGVTALLTYPGDLGGLYDRRLEPLMQRAGGLFHLSAVPGGRRRGILDIRKLRFESTSVAPVQFRIEAGAGFVQDGDPNATEEPTREERLQQLLLVNLDTPFPGELLQGLEVDFRVTVRAGVTAAFSDLVRAGVGGVLLNVSRGVIDDARQLVRELRHSDVRAPIMFVTPYVLRSSDRTRALRAGADEFVSATLPRDEFVERVASMVRRGRSPNTSPSAGDRGAVLQPTAADGSYRVMDRQAFGMAVRAHISGARAPYFTLVVLRPDRGNPADIAELLLRTARVDSGDLIGAGEGEALLMADSARPKDLESLFHRLTETWHTQSGGAGLSFEAFAFPTDEERIQVLLGGAG